MITKGIVEEIVDSYQIKVRLPIFDGTESSKYNVDNDELSLATICSLPSSNSYVNVGDIVFVGFEDNDISKPIIIGHLFRENMTSTKINLELGSLTTSSITQLNENTSIGIVKPEEIKYLSGVNGAIQLQINELRNSIEELNDKVKDLEGGNNV